MPLGQRHSHLLSIQVQLKVIIFPHVNSWTPGHSSQSL